MSEGFDYDAYRQQQDAQKGGSDPDRALIVTFEYASKAKGDGTFKNIEMIKIWIDKDNEIIRQVTDDDRTRFAARYAAFKAGEEAPIDGTPINMVAFATPADIAGCRAERIFTVEQIVEKPDERLQKAKLINFKYKCRDWLESQQRSGHVGELREQIDHLKAQNDVLREKNRALSQGSGSGQFTLKALKSMGLPALREYCQAHDIKASNGKDKTLKNIEDAGAFSDNGDAA